METNRPQRSLVSESISFAFNGIITNIKSWLFTMLSIVFFMILALGLAFLAALFLGLLALFAGLNQQLVTMLTYLLMVIAYVLYLASIGLGFKRTMIAFYDTNAVTFRGFWNMRSIGSFLIANMLVTLLFLGGLILVIAPGIIVLYRTIFTTLFIVDKNMGPIAAIKASWNLTRDKSHTMLGLLIVTFLINCIPVIGWLFTGLMMAYVYRELSKQAEQNTEQRASHYRSSETEDLL